MQHKRLARKDRSNLGMVQKRPFSGNTRDLSADPDRSRVGAEGPKGDIAIVCGTRFARFYPPGLILLSG